MERLLVAPWAYELRFLCRLYQGVEVWRTKQLALYRLYRARAANLTLALAGFARVMLFS